MMATKLKNLRLSELSLVDAPANKAAQVTIFKRDEGGDPLMKRKYTDEQRQQGAKDGWAKPDGSYPIKDAEDLENAVRAWGRGGATASDKEWIISRAKALGKTELLPDGWVSKSAGSPGDAEKGKSDMTAALKKALGLPETATDDDLAKKVAEMTTATADLTKKLDDVTKAKDAAEAIAAMSDIEKAHYDKLPDAEKPAFLALNKGLRTAAIHKAAEADQVIYKASDGSEYRKSDDPRLVAMAKARDEDAKVIKAEREARETAEFTKRAETELAHLPGTPAEKAALLKALASTDEAVRKTAEAILKAGEGAIKGAFSKIGVGKGDVDGSPEAKLNTLAKAKAEKENVSFAKAYSAVLDTEEGQRLYAESRQAAA